MKKFTFLVVAIFFATISTSVKSQDYIPFPPDSTSEWRIDEQWWNPNPWEITTISYRMYFDGTEQIGDLIFNLLYADGKNVYDPPNGMPPVVSTFQHEFIGSICTDGSKVYYNYPGNLVFDYSWQAGDTVKDCIISENCPNGYNPLIITSIDSIEINGREHLRYNFDDLYGNINWFIEGIGHEYGIFHQACMTTDYGSYFECYAENDEPVFPEDANCILTVGTNEVPAVEQKFEIYPNPATTQITLSTNSVSGADVLVKISDLTGRTLKTENWKVNTGKNVKSLDLSGFNPGMYFVTLTGENGETVARKKVLVE